MDLGFLDLSEVIMDRLVGLPNLDPASLGQIANRKGMAIAQLLLGVLTIQMIGLVLPLMNEMRLDDLMHQLRGLLLFLLEEVLQHDYYIIF